MLRSTMANTIPPRAADREPIDDYQVDRELGQATRPVTHHLLGLMNGLLLVILAAVSFALFWIAATFLGVM